MDHIEKLWSDYLDYLIRIGNLQREAKQYRRLFEILHDIPFSYLLDRDDNREDDGIKLREDYIIPDRFGNWVIEEFQWKPCSVFEMMLGLSIRVDDEIIGDPREEHPEIFFMEMIENLRLDRFDGNSILKESVVRIVRRWLDREFSPSGVGSPFPVPEDQRDQRNLEIWDQAISYIHDNY